MSFLIIATSLNPQSRSRIMAKEAQNALKEQDEDVVFVDLFKCPLPICDGQSVYETPEVQNFSETVRNAQGILLAVPIYNYDANAAAKNLVELTGDAWKEKVVGFICAAGGNSSYMSVMGLANSLMLDFRCLILPRFVYATGKSFKEGALIDGEVKNRLAELAKGIVWLSRVTACPRSV
ncbi:MAG: NADPH-dependent FMN reductase [Nitrospinota bacterium]|nr:NADPH-dependent FMN reductase [Nitrospinota bacterium]